MRRKTQARTTLLFLALLGVAVLAAAQSPSGVVNINTASLDELSLLPRIGPSLAQRIIDFREANGRFKATEELILVRGIGDSTYEMLEPFITLEGATTLTEPVATSRESDEA